MHKDVFFECPQCYRIFSVAFVVERNDSDSVIQGFWSEVEGFLGIPPRLDVAVGNGFEVELARRLVLYLSLDVVTLVRTRTFLVPRTVV